MKAYAYSGNIPFQGNIPLQGYGGNIPFQGNIPLQGYGRYGAGAGGFVDVVPFAWEGHFWFWGPPQLPVELLEGLDVAVNVEPGAFYTTDIPEGWVYYHVLVGDYPTQEEAAAGVAAFQDVLSERDYWNDMHVPDKEDYIEVGVGPAKKKSSWIPIALGVGGVIGLVGILYAVTK